ncbi:MAG: ABC transporter substrate-binding protein [Candidatus Binatia bacterium]
MRILFGRRWVALLAAAWSLVGMKAEATADVEELLAAINKKPEAERRKTLFEGAQKERIVYYYGSTSLSDTQEIIRGFNKQYPFIEVRFTRLGGASVANKVMTEYRANVHNVDVVSLRGTFVPELAERKIIIKYDSPNRLFLRKGFADAEGYLSGVYATGYTMIYNTKRVKPGEAPKSYEDLLQPRWKGRLVIDAEGYDWFAGIIDLWGEAKANSFLQKLTNDQNLKFLRGGSHTHMTQLVAAGEHDLLIDGYVHNGVEIKGQGAPIDYVFVTPVIVRPPSTVSITSKPPHPHAAALFTDYKLSKESHELMAHKQSRWTTRADVKWITEPNTEVHVVSPLKWGRKYNDVVASFKKITGT